MVRSFPTQRGQAGGQLRSIDSNVPLRLPESATGGGESSGQFAEAYAGGRKCDPEGFTTLLGAARCGGCTSGRAAPIPASAAQQRGSLRGGQRTRNCGGASSRDF